MTHPRFEASAQEILTGFLWLGGEDAGLAPIEDLKAHGTPFVPS